MRPLRQIGLLHPAGQSGDRILFLQQELERAADPAGSLIVLPEAINIGSRYNHPPWSIDPAALDRLSRLALRFEVTFIAGLMVEKEGQWFNLAFAVDRDEAVCVAGKRSADGNPYRPYEGARFAPLDFHWRQVATLICLDAFDFEDTAAAARDQWPGLIASLRKSPGHTPILCVPSHTPRLIPSEHYEGIHFIMANGGDCASIIHLSGGQREEIRAAGLHLCSLLTTMKVIAQLSPTLLVVDIDHRPARPLDGLERCVIVNWRDASCSDCPLPLDSINVHTHGALSLDVKASQLEQDEAVEIARRACR